VTYTDRYNIRLCTIATSHRLHFNVHQILELVHQLYPKQKHLISQYDKITRDVKGIEDEYRKSWVKYEQAYFVAHMSYKECKSAGLSVKILDQVSSTLSNVYTFSLLFCRLLIHNRLKREN